MRRNRASADVPPFWVPATTKSILRFTTPRKSRSTSGRQSESPAPGCFKHLRPGILPFRRTAAHAPDRHPASRFPAPRRFRRIHRPSSHAVQDPRDRRRKNGPRSHSPRRPFSLHVAPFPSEAPPALLASWVPESRASKARGRAEEGRCPAPEMGSPTAAAATVKRGSSSTRQNSTTASAKGTEILRTPCHRAPFAGRSAEEVTGHFPFKISRLPA